MTRTPLAALFEKALGERHLLYASLELTYACNFACRFCYNPVDRKGQERSAPAPPPAGSPLSLAEIVDLLDQLRAMQVLYFTLTGGEAMRHPDFWEVLEAAKARAFAIRVFSNGSLIGAEAADRLARICPNCVEISLYGASPETYGRICGAPKAFDKVMRALELLRERRLTVYLKCPLNRLVEDEMEAIQATGDSLGFPVYFDPVLSPSDDGLDYPLAFQASEEALRRLYGDPRFRAGSSPFERGENDSTCNIGKSLIHVDPYGFIHPCIQLRRPLGNVRTHRIAEVWRHSPELGELRKMSLEAAARLREATPDHAYCHHCLGLSQLRHGDPMRPEDQQIRLARIRRECRPTGG
jgi:MoaA/NifB/PqqE/SkfB family radical SAM enzyme